MGKRPNLAWIFLIFITLITLVIWLLINVHLFSRAICLAALRTELVLFCAYSRGLESEFSSSMFVLISLPPNPIKGGLNMGRFDGRFLMR